MNLTITIDKIKGLLEQLKDASDKTDVKYPANTPESVLLLQKKNIAKSADISEQILDEAQSLALFFNAKDESEKVGEVIETKDEAKDEPIIDEE